VPRIVELRPDLVVANAEENRAADLDALRAAGVAVWVTAPETVPQALRSLGTVLAACRLDRPGWLDEAVQALGGPAHRASAHRRRAGLAAAVDGGRPRHLHRRRPAAPRGGQRAGGVAGALPRVRLDELPPHDLVVLPDEPYAFSADDGPEAFPGVPAALVSGRHLTWYGPSLVEAPGLLLRQLAR
jgi:hypothetical protein